jgi:O-antigen/teichoic acid export membrane protein
VSNGPGPRASTAVPTPPAGSRRTGPTTGRLAVPPLVWSVAQHVGRQAIAVGAFVVIARYIGAADLGVLGVAMLWIAFLSVFADLGFSAALVQRRTVSPAHVSSAFYLNVALGTALALLGVALAHPIAALLGTRDAAPVMRWLSIGFLCSALSSVQTALAQREMRFSALAARDLVAMAAGAAAGVILATRGWGVYSLVAQSLTSAVLGTILLWGLSPHRFGPGECSREALAELWAFGAHVSGFSVFKYVVRNVDGIAIAAVLGPHALGVYLFAQQLVLQPAAGVEAGVGSLVFARGAALHAAQPERVAPFYLSAITLLNWVFLAWAVVVTIAAPPALRAFFGGKWEESLALLTSFAVVAVARAPITVTGHITKAIGRPDWLLRWSIGFTALGVLCLIVGLRWGLEGAVRAVATSHLLSLAYIGYTARQYLGIGPSDWARAVGTAYVATAMLAVTLLWAPPYLPQRSLTFAATVTVLAAAGLAAALWRSPIGLLLSKEPA